jgi:hypothetical protein
METANISFPKKETDIFHAALQKKFGKKCHSTDVERKSLPVGKNHPFLIQVCTSAPKADENPTGAKKNATSMEKNISYDIEDPTFAYGTKEPENFKDETSFRIEINRGLVARKMNKSYN